MYYLKQEKMVASVGYMKVYILEMGLNLVTSHSISVRLVVPF